METKKKYRLNIIDIIILIALIGVIAGFSFYAMGKWQSNSGIIENAEEKTITYTIRVNEVPEEVAKAVKVGDKVRDTAKNMNKGEVVAVSEIKPYEMYSEDNQEGGFKLVTIPNRYMVDVSIKSEFSTDGGTIKINDTDIKIGSTMSLKTDRYAISGVISEMKIQ